MVKNLIKGVMMAGLLLILGSGAFANMIWFECTVSGGDPITSESGGLLPQGCLVQLIRSSDPYIGTPDASGIPVDGDVIIRVGSIGGTPDASYSDGEVRIVSSEANNTFYYAIRAWNAPSVNAASRYGTSAVSQNTGDFSTLTANPPSFSTTFPAPAPAGPTGFIGTAESLTSIRWRWNNMAGELSYDVCSSDGVLKTTTLADVTTTLEVVGITAGNYPYARYVKAHLTNGQTTGPSNQYVAYSLAITPDAITAKSGWNSASGYYVTVTWEAANNAGTGYYTRHVGGADLPATTLKIGTEEALSANTVYTFEVRAVNGNGIYTAYGKRATATTPPGAPTISTINVTTSEITWYWTPSAGADIYNFYSDAGVNLAGITATVVTTDALLSCRAYHATVEAVSTANGTGAPGIKTKWTLPVVPSPFGGATGVAGTHSVNLSWSPDSGNVSAVYEIQDSTVSASTGYETREAAYSGTAYIDYSLPADTSCYFRIRAKNGDGEYSDFTAPINIQSSGAGGGGGLAPTIVKVMINNRTFKSGDLISSKPNLTAIVSGDIDTSYRYVCVDPLSLNPMVLPVSDITFEPAPGMPAGTWLLKAVFSIPIPAEPVNAHTIRIVVKSMSGAQAIWDGDVAVLSGAVQVVGAVYNYPNPFKPLSADPSMNSTMIQYNLSVDAPVMVVIYDISGHEMQRIVSPSGANGGRAGVNSVSWRGKNLFEEVVGNGMYIYKIISGGRVIGTGKLVVLD